MMDAAIAFISNPAAFPTLPAPVVMMYTKPAIPDSNPQSRYEVEFRSLHVDAEHQSALTVAANGVEIAPETRPLHEDDEEDDKDHHDDGAEFDFERDEIAQPVVRAEPGNHDLKIPQVHEIRQGHVERILVDRRQQSIRQEHPCQRYDEWLYLEIGNEISLQETKRDTDAQREKYGTPDAPHSRFQQYGTAHGYQAGQRADGNVDAASDHDDAHAQRQDDERSVQAEQVEEGLKLQETARIPENGKPVHQDKDDRGDEKQKIRIRQCIPRLGLYANPWFGCIQRSHPTPPSSQECPGWKPLQRLVHLSLVRCRSLPWLAPIAGLSWQIP